MFMKFNQKEGSGKPAPQSGIAYYGYIIYNNFSQIVMLNIIFLICCIPIITAPAALIAVNRVFFKLIRERNVLFFTEYFCEFKRSFLKSIPMGIILAILFVDAYYLFNLAILNNNTILKSLAFCVVLLAICLGEYIFTLMAVQDLSNKVILKNAVFLMILGWKTSIGILLLNILCVCFLIFALPVSIIFFILGIVIIKQYTICWITNNLFNLYIIKN